MGGSQEGILKLYTEDAVVVSPEDYNNLVRVVKGLINNVFFGYNTTAGDTITASGDDIPIHKEELKGNNYTHDVDSAEVAVGSDGTYEITAECGFVFEVGTLFELSLWRYTNTWREIPGSKAFCGEVMRSLESPDSCSITRIISLGVGDKIKMVGRILYGPNAKTADHTVRLKIKQVKLNV